MESPTSTQICPFRPTTPLGCCNLLWFSSRASKCDDKGALRYPTVIWAKLKEHVAVTDRLVLIFHCRQPVSKMKEDREKVQSLLLNTVGMLCRNSLRYSAELKVEGLIGITLDNDEVFLIHLNEVFQKDFVQETPFRSRKRPSQSTNKCASFVPSEPVLDMPYGTGSSQVMEIPEESSPPQQQNNPKRRKKRKSSRGSRETSPAMKKGKITQNESSVVVKTEPDEEDVILNCEDSPTGENLDLEASEGTSGFLGFGDDHSMEAIHSHSDAVIPSAGAFITGVVKNTNTAVGGSENEADPGAYWDSVALATAPNNASWTSSSADGKLSANSTSDMVGSIFLVSQNCSRVISFAFASCLSLLWDVPCRNAFQRWHPKRTSHPWYVCFFYQIVCFVVLLPGQWLLPRPLSHFEKETSHAI